MDDLYFINKEIDQLQVKLNEKLAQKAELLKGTHEVFHRYINWKPENNKYFKGQECQIIKQ